ncbi:hypothetical protein VQ643_14145 [Pseudomonas sp. F1_0610]|uniref:hypothetical protein n=1 Tax=Pseudomonas sp. F1_0610 TaxID=3114284 RepID=UPI0039C4105E
MVAPGVGTVGGAITTSSAAGAAGATGGGLIGYWVGDKLCPATADITPSVSNDANCGSNTTAGGCSGSIVISEALTARKEWCIEYCSDVALPTRDNGFSFWKCVNDCIGDFE